MFIKEITPSNMKNLKVSIEEFINLYNEGKCELIDVREDFEIKVWALGFGTRIPAKDLPENLEKLPKNKIIVTACPGTARAIASAMYLRSEDFDARFLDGGLLKLLEYLKGGKAKLINIG